MRIFLCTHKHSAIITIVMFGIQTDLITVVRHCYQIPSLSLLVASCDTRHDQNDVGDDDGDLTTTF